MYFNDSNFFSFFYFYYLTQTHLLPESFPCFAGNYITFWIHVGYRLTIILSDHISLEMRMKQVLTMEWTESLAVKARISAQETTPGHSASTTLFIVSMKPKPRRVRFGGESFSAWLPCVEFTSTDPSQPWN